MKKYKHILICRDDSIGDVVLTLPMAGYFKESDPNCKVFFLGKTYTKPVVQCCEHVDEFVNADELNELSEKDQIQYLKKLDIDEVYFAFPRKQWVRLAFLAKIPMRVGVSRRWYNWLYCNRRPSFSRRKSNLHEAQLNFKLISAFTGKANISKDEIKNLYGFTKPELENPELLDLLNTPKTKVILHPLSQGSAMEWGLKNFNELAHYLEQKDCRVYIAGTKKEGSKIVQNIDFGNDIIDLTGKMSLVEYISFIGCCDALVAASTGPLHIAAALNLFAIGLYSCKRPIHPERWAPIGKNAEYIETKKSDDSLESISVNQVAEKLLKGLR